MADARLITPEREARTVSEMISPMVQAGIIRFDQISTAASAAVKSVRKQQTTAAEDRILEKMGRIITPEKIKWASALAMPVALIARAWVFK